MEYLVQYRSGTSRCRANTDVDYMVSIINGQEIYTEQAILGSMYDEVPDYNETRRKLIYIELLRRIKKKARNRGIDDKSLTFTPFEERIDQTVKAVKEQEDRLDEEVEIESLPIKDTISKEIGVDTVGKVTKTKKDEDVVLEKSCAGVKENANGISQVDAKEEKNVHEKINTNLAAYGAKIAQQWEDLRNKLENMEEELAAHIEENGTCGGEIVFGKMRGIHMALATLREIEREG